MHFQSLEGVALTFLLVFLHPQGCCDLILKLMQLTNALSFFVWVVDIPTEDWIAPSFQSALQVFSKYWCASLSDQSDKARLPEGLITSQPVTFRLFAYLFDSMHTVGLGITVLQFFNGYPTMGVHLLLLEWHGQ